MIDKNRLETMAKELAEGVKTQDDLSDLSRMLTKLTVETALGAEMEHLLGYAKHDKAGDNSGNSRNGSSGKRLQGSHGDVEIRVPRDRKGEFDPKIVGKGERFRKVLVNTKGARERSRNLGYFKTVCKARPVIIPLMINENLSFMF